MPIVAVFGGSVAPRGDALYDVALRCGRLLAAAGIDVATGGYGGVMEAVSEGAATTGGRVIGVTAPAVFPGRSGANGYVVEEHPADTIGARIARLIELSDASIALPGSLGTATELMVAWNYAFVTRFSHGAPKPVCAVGEPWAVLVPALAASLDTDGDLVRLFPDVDAAVAWLAPQLTTAAPQPAGP